MGRPGVYVKMLWEPHMVFNTYASCMVRGHITHSSPTDYTVKHGGPVYTTSGDWHRSAWLKDYVQNNWCSDVPHLSLLFKSSLTQDNLDRIAPHLSLIKAHVVPHCGRLAGLLWAVVELAGLFPVKPCWRGVDSLEGPGTSSDRAVSTALGEVGEWEGMEQSRGSTELSSDSSSSNRGKAILVSSCWEKRPKVWKLGLYCKGVGWEEEKWQWQSAGSIKEKQWNTL